MDGIDSIDRRRLLGMAAMVPLIGLYELSIILSRVVTRKRAQAAAEAAA